MNIKKTGFSPKVMD